ncbi:MAG: hypothetical protein ACREXR_01855 [Gammaproteobacteria bacterium]
MTNDDIKPDALKASIKSMDQVDKQVEFVVRLSNTATRALHYIADVRATRYDSDTKTLTLSLSDEGRQVIPGTINKLPVFRYIDPESEAEIRLRVPDRVVKLSRTAPPGELAFETYQLSDMQGVVIEIAWADVPFYKDTRPRIKETLIEVQLAPRKYEQRVACISLATGDLYNPPPLSLASWLPCLTMLRTMWSCLTQGLEWKPDRRAS